MKKIFAMMLIAVATMASCEKKEYVPMDTISNHGTGIAILNDITLKPGQTRTVPHAPMYWVVCGEGCEVRINGVVMRTGGIIHTPEPTNHRK